MTQRNFVRVPTRPYASHMPRHLLAIMSACAMLLASTTCALASSGSENNPAPIAHRTGYDPRRAVSFDLNGRTLTVTVAPKALVRGRLLGQNLLFVCGRRSKRSTITTQALSLWASSSTSTTLTLPDDISAVANFCLIRTKTTNSLVAIAQLSR